ncbi:MAG TPA: HAMP domain-containing sensor histidine kinase [Candidatus Limnocylindrales bacterium]
MSDPRSARLPSPAPSVAPPPPFVERRRTFRRAADRRAHEETRLLARALDVLAADHAPDARLAGLLDLLASTVGARRAAVVSDGPERSVAVVAHRDDDVIAAEALGAWLDAAAPRSRARRAAAGLAPISVVRPAVVGGRATTRSAVRPGGPFYAVVPIPAAGEVALGFEFAEPVQPGTIAERLPPSMARHAAVALALVTDALTTERALEDLRAGEAERERFVSTIAHELRTPLTGLAGYLDLILEGKVGDTAVEREFLERGRTIVHSMAGLVGDLLELSRLESGSIALEITAFSVAEAMTAVASGLLPIAMDRGLDLRSDLPPRLQAATGDRRRVEQILTNLGANAIKFGGAAGGRVELSGRSDGTVAIIVVRDEGPGIDDEDRPRIFERFYRIAGHERVTGTGLGLPIARDLARAMGGDLDVASIAGAGSSFVLALPGPVGAAPAKVAATLTASLVDEAERLRRAAIIRANAGPRPEPAAGRPDGIGTETERHGSDDRPAIPAGARR